ncbi:suppressor of cytokine signaling 2 [Eublepharis macularius]|uniref:Suppressor of cytokine signaling 2 n=1 Tax=Eublepharis macularius TaxID=481883 RepID=A0AA97JSC7_EUBMA|nr:suppressor of cytokine signaling 2 [Eublepharis macularius]
MLPAPESERIRHLSPRRRRRGAGERARCSPRLLTLHRRLRLPSPVQAAQENAEARAKPSRRRRSLLRPGSGWAGATVRTSAEGRARLALPAPGLPGFRPQMTLRSAEPSDGTDRAGGVEADRLDSAMRELRRSGWYWGNMSVAEAKERLQDTSEGTFLVRDSSHSEYLLTISVKTSAGPTNLRIEFQDGKFRLDSIICVRSRLRQFNSVVHLIEYYVLMCHDRSTAPEMASNGTVHLYLNKPLYRSAPSLQHHCRIAINRYTKEIQELPLPTRLKEYLKDYQYQV